MCRNNDPFCSSETSSRPCAEGGHGDCGWLACELRRAYARGRPQSYEHNKITGSRFRFRQVQCLAGDKRGCSSSTSNLGERAGAHRDGVHYGLAEHMETRMWTLRGRTSRLVVKRESR